MWQLYLTCAVIGLIGMALAVVLKMNSLRDKARVANVDFTASLYFKTDWGSILGSILTIALALFFVQDAIEKYPQVWVIKMAFGFIGYTGSDIASRAFSVFNRRLNNIIDVKTNVSDEVSPNAAPSITEKIPSKNP